MGSNRTYHGVHQEENGKWRGVCIVEEQTFRAPLQNSALEAAIARDKILYKLRRPLAMQIGLNAEQVNWIEDTPLISQELVDTQGIHGNSYRGVFWAEESSKWHAKIRVKGNVETLGYFRDEEEAAKVYDWAVLDRDGRGAGTRCNHPENFITWCHVKEENPVLERETNSPEGAAAMNSHFYAMLENLDLKKYGL
ncbi:hypothetical protein WJX73_005400 [Symbiochloris irregularis]|uniref:AP2/ERF domain-containing protein n=1 Tax=Symbiochloris irregularis TaxID=706552 RepID=A0AAW1NTM9_9CHLO